MSADAKKPKLSGIFTPNLVPLDERGNIHEAELWRYVEWLIARGVHGLYPNGSTGEFTRYTAEERRRIVRIVCEVCRGRVPVLAGAAEANVRETVAACEAYLEYGARAVAIVSPFYYRLSPEGVYAYFREIALASPIDVTLYNIPMFASPIDVPTLQKLSELPRIVGIKDSSGDVAFMSRMIDAVRPKRPDFTFLAGWEPVLAPAIWMGADGGTNATSGIAPELTRKLFEAATARRMEEAVALQYQLTELFDVMLNAGDFPGGFRAGVEVRGFEFSRGRQPLSEGQEKTKTQTKEKIRGVLGRIGVL